MEGGFNGDEKFLFYTAKLVLQSPVSALPGAILRAVYCSAVVDSGSLGFLIFPRLVLFHKTRSPWNFLITKGIPNTYCKDFDSAPRIDKLRTESLLVLGDLWSLLCPNWEAIKICWFILYPCPLQYHSTVCAIVFLLFIH